jgi:hypothetical protein
MKQPWEQLKNESAKAYAQFNRYRNLKPSERSVDLAWRNMQAEKGTKSASSAAGYYKAWSVNFSWKKRAEAWDAEQVKAGDDAVLDEITEKKKKYAKNLELVLGKCFLRLGLVKDKKREAGEPMTEGEAGRIVPKLVESIMLLMGEPTGRVEQTGSNAVNITIASLIGELAGSDGQAFHRICGEVSSRKRQVEGRSPVSLPTGAGLPDNGGNGKGHRSEG